MFKQLGLGLTMTLLFSLGAKANYQVKNTFHNDHRTTVKVLNEVSFVAGKKSGEAVAEAFIKENQQLFGLVSLDQLKLTTVKSSLLGKHYHFQQMVDGVEVDGAEIIVSVDRNRVYRAFNNVQPLTAGFVSLNKAKIDSDQAYDIAWKDLGVQGKLMALPQEQKKIIFVKDQPRLVFETELAVEKPFGYWRHYIDAQSGEILLREDTRISRKEVTKTFFRNPGPAIDRKKAFKAYKPGKVSTFKEVERGTGQGLVFDPDPRTSLNDNTLADNSDPSAFENAYFRRDLPDLAIVDGKYTFAGPWVTIADFESPQTAPSTSETGRWEARRGDNSFNDAMTYYHLDKNQRYMQSLGFKDDKGIQFGSIHVDSDGVNGSDNSHYVPSSNRMAFGHGCVDDNEDADVILHEYGHAINFSINSNWRGGDTGAMGEGFGDYWAGSYSISTTNGDTFKVNEVFTWDGHGESNACWPGRRMDRREARYDHNRNYGAHARIEGGIQSDELWSTPLFQALLQLVADGHPREDVDRVILEAHFGLGSGMKMRGMAEAIVATARRLYPSKPYADVFIAQFAHHNIIELPKARFTMSVTDLSGTGSNGKIDPGESAGLSLKFTNNGTADATSITAKVSTTTGGVTIGTSEFSVGDLAMGGSVDLSDAIRLAVASDNSCGSKINLNVRLEFSGGAISHQEIPVELGTGVPIGILSEKTHEGGLSIPDNKPDQAAVSVMTVADADGVLDGSTLKVAVNLKHTYIGDLNVRLTAPDGKSVLLHGRSGGGNDNINGVYPTSLTPKEDLAGLSGAPLNGDWKLTASDHAGSDTGQIFNWGLEAVSRYECE